VTNGPLTALTGVYAYGSANTFPANTYQNSNFWVDVVFNSSGGGGTAPSVTGVTPAAGSSSNPVSTAPAVTFSQAVTPSTASFTLTGPGGTTVAGATSFNSADTVATFTPSAQLAAGTTYTATVSGAQNSSGQTMTPFTFTFTTSKAFDAGGQCPCAVWPDTAPAAATDANDPSPNNIGVEFQVTSNGTISGIRFYKEPDNTGTHTGTLWTATGTKLATGTFASEPTQGWAELDFATPVQVTAGTTYVASYQTQTGHYAFTGGGLAAPVTNGPLTALTGVYAYGSANTFPANTYQNSNFWVDVVFNSS
jgi:hypothetical protein